MAADVRAGLTSPFKELSPRYFYDERGSELFEEITGLDEYYPTRCEREILETKASEISEAANRPASLIELGSGSARKTRVLLDAMREASCLEAYCPVDISEEITRDTAEAIASEYEGIRVHGLVCDFEFDLERVPVEGPRVIALLGGTIGNFAPHQRAGFLRRIANLLGPEDRFLLGTDLVKEPAILEAAYNDSRGVTAEFNKNVLAVLNRQLGADFDLDSFEHVARWDPENLWMDIRLRSLANQVVNFAALDILVPFGAGEEMRTEISTKFLRPGLEGIYAEAGLELTDWWTDREGLYALSLARAANSSS
ncbi:MAG TPA: L-histidine N(alpha)-methyltransferase [Solirubrobacterales bacterium]|jgi:L-histidine Nalpha-methyltransferase|nr:L-histidine N(alpha)-methyltransferase [Solirubrobacterales bacterium]